MTRQQAREILAEKKFRMCDCGNDIYSSFDILFLNTYSACVDCYLKVKSKDEVDEMSKPIFKLIEVL